MYLTLSDSRRSKDVWLALFARTYSDPCSALIIAAYSLPEILEKLLAHEEQNLYIP